MQHQHEDSAAYIERLLRQGQIKLKSTNGRCDDLSMVCISRFICISPACTDFATEDTEGEAAAIAGRWALFCHRGHRFRQNAVECGWRDRQRPLLSKPCPAPGWAADAQKRVPTTTWLHLSGAEARPYHNMATPDTNLTSKRQTSDQPRRPRRPRRNTNGSIWGVIAWIHPVHCGALFVIFLQV
jgi:hypothetical protein